MVIFFTLWMQEKLQSVTCSACSTLVAVQTALSAISRLVPPLVSTRDCPPTGWMGSPPQWKCFPGNVPFSSGTNSCHKVIHLENVTDVSFQGVMAAVQMMVAFWVCIPCLGTWFVVTFLWDVTNQIHYICENPTRRPWFAHGRCSAVAHVNCDTSIHMGACCSCASHVSSGRSIHGLLEPRLLPVIMQCCLNKVHTCTSSEWQLV